MSEKSVTIGSKVKSGYALLILLLIGLLCVGLYSLRQSSHGFDEYRDLALHTNLAGRIQANLLSARSEVNDYLLHPTEIHKQKFHERWDKMKAFVTDAKTHLAGTAQESLIKEIADNATTYETAFDDVVAAVEREHEVLEKFLDVRGPEIEHALTSLASSAAEDRQLEEAFAAATAERTLLLARLYVNKYLHSSSEDHAARVRKELDATTLALTGLREKLTHPERRKLCSQALENMNIYGEKWNVLHSARQDRNAIVTGTLDKIGPLIADDAENAKLSILKSQDELGPRLILANSSASRFILAIGIIALFAAILLGWLISRSINVGLSDIAQRLGLSSVNVNSAASQVSASSQELAAGASEQASSLEETSASLEELSSMTRQNAENALKAKSMVDGVRQSAENGRVEMTRMSESIERIKHSADETAKIVRTIDEIAFQTNLLALNAAVEAARAGDAGKGFAVVAEEVRSLAQRSAEAARTTAALIDESQRNAAGGVDVTRSVSESLDRIITEIRSVTTIVADVSSASQEQSKGIEQINVAISQIDRATQSCAANAEECAASSQELSAQATNQREMVHALERMVLGVQSREETPPPPQRSEVAGLRETFARHAQRAVQKRRDGKMPRTIDRVAELSPADFE